jgi:hypothetical protein
MRSPAQDPGERQLEKQIETLWASHAQAQSVVKKSRQELKDIRLQLSENLYELKSVLSRPGRAGAWSSFLAAQSIPRSTADTLVRGYKRRLGLNCTSEQIPLGPAKKDDPPEVVARRYFWAAWPRLCRVFTSPEAVDLFISELQARRRGAVCREGSGQHSAISFQQEGIPRSGFPSRHIPRSSRHIPRKRRVGGRNSTPARAGTARAGEPFEGIARPATGPSRSRDCMGTIGVLRSAPRQAGALRSA